MKKAIFAIAGAALLGLSSQAYAADKGNLSQDMLSQYGMSGAKVMSDVNAQSIRGKGFVFAGGYGTASVVSIWPIGAATRTDAIIVGSVARPAVAGYLQISNAKVGSSSATATGFTIGFAR